VLAIEFLRSRADECRAVAETFVDEALRRQILIMAELYDNLAIQVELIAAKQECGDYHGHAD